MRLLKGFLDYQWSSYRVNANGLSSKLIDEHPLYRALGIDQSKKLVAYQNLFSLTLSLELLNEIRDAMRGNFVLGTNKFKQEIENSIGCRVSPSKAGRPRVRGN